MIKIPISSSAPHFSQEHILFGHSYMLEFEWLERQEMWILHMYDGAESTIALGLRVAENMPIFIDRVTGIIFWLMTKKPNASLGLLSFHKDYDLMAEVVDAPV